MCQSQSVCLCSGINTLPRTTTFSGGQTSTDCSYTTMPTEMACPADTSCSLGWNPQSSPYCTCSGVQIPMTVGDTCGTTTVPPPTTVAPSTAPAATSSIAPPPTMGAVVCTPWLDSYSKCHKDMDVSKLNETAEHLVNYQMPPSPSFMTSKSPNYTQVYNAASGVSYIANVGWIPGCTQYASQNPTYPSGNTNDENWTYNIIYWNWLHCMYSMIPSRKKAKKKTKTKLTRPCVQAPTIKA